MPKFASGENKPLYGILTIKSIKFFHGSCTVLFNRF